MWISKAKYESLKNAKELNVELEKEVKRLARVISNTTKDCKVGPWCKDCAHKGIDSAKVFGRGRAGSSEYVKAIGGEVIYCKKHLHDICPEWRWDYKTYRLD